MGTSGGFVHPRQRGRERGLEEESIANSGRWTSLVLLFILVLPKIGGENSIFGQTLTRIHSIYPGSGSLSKTTVDLDHRAAMARGF